MKMLSFISLLALALPFSLIGQTALPSPSELIARANSAQKAQDDRGWKYTFSEDHSDSQLDKNGKAGPLSTRTYDHIMLEGSEYRKLVLIDRKPLDAKTQKKVDEDLERVRAERRKSGIPGFHRTVSFGGLDLLPRLFENRVTGEDTVLGRMTWRMESEPKRGYVAANKQEEEALASRRVNWFDQEDGFNIKISNLIIRAANGFQPGTTIDLEFVKIGEEWLWAHWAMRADMKWMPGIHGRVESHERFYDFKRFVVDSNMTAE